MHAKLLEEWKYFGFTESFFFKIYSVERKLKNIELKAVERERCELLQTILNGRKAFVIALKVITANIMYYLMLMITCRVI